MSARGTKGTMGSIGLTTFQGSGGLISSGRQNLRKGGRNNNGCSLRTEFSKPMWINEQLHREIVKDIPMGRIGETVAVDGGLLAR